MSIALMSRRGSSNKIRARRPPVTKFRPAPEPSSHSPLYCTTWLCQWHGQGIALPWIALFGEAVR